MLGGNGGNIPQTLDQLLERQWEQGSQFLMEQAQHFDSMLILLLFLFNIYCIFINLQLLRYYHVCINCVRKIYV